MNPLMKLWFWLLIISIIGFIIAFIAFERYSITNGTSTQTPGWVWIVLIISFLFWLVSLILYALDMANYHRKREIAEACGLIPPPPKKTIVCPKKECVEKKVIECVTKRPCDTMLVQETHQTVVSVPPVNEQISTIPSPIPTPISNNPYIQQTIPPTQTTTISNLDRRQQSTLKPINSLTPVSLNVIS